MATAVRPHPLHAPVTAAQRHRAAHTIRTIGRLAPRPNRSHFACSTCSVAWSGPEADCWSCGRPATLARSDASLLHRLLIHPVTPRAGRR
ncbi:hypothetical protein ABZ926_19500 [Streptomyces litmocidini]|uniref:hypothetical protein n=1 Tax=Streptomyces litmocidini TaxID=67318 RepID=UPI0033DDD062